MQVVFLKKNTSYVARILGKDGENFGNNMNAINAITTQNHDWVCSSTKCCIGYL